MCTKPMCQFCDFDFAANPSNGRPINQSNTHPDLRVPITPTQYSRAVAAVLNERQPGSDPGEQVAWIIAATLN